LELCGSASVSEYLWCWRWSRAQMSTEFWEDRETNGIYTFIAVCCNIKVINCLSIVRQTRRVQKGTELFKWCANQHRERPAATEGT
jgi:hypothetical protein